jgi:hypothetical protein
MRYRADYHAGSYVEEDGSVTLLKGSKAPVDCGPESLSDQYRLITSQGQAIHDKVVALW